MQNRYLLEMLVNFKMFGEELYENTLNKLHPQTLSKAYNTAWNNLEKFAGFLEGLPKPPDDSLLLLIYGTDKWRVLEVSMNSAAMWLKTRPS